MTEEEAQQKADKWNLQTEEKLCPFFDRTCQNICVAYIPAITMILDIRNEKDVWRSTIPRCKRLEK